MAVLGGKVILPREHILNPIYIYMNTTGTQGVVKNNEKEDISLLGRVNEDTRGDRWR